MSKRYAVLTASTVILLAMSGTRADNFTLDWWTLDGGGAMQTTGGTFELSGTMGQPDAGPALTGGSFSLTGGFWSGAVVCKGDMNCDGVVDFKDINPFVAILSGATPCNAANADTNSDGAIDFKDINPFVAILSGGGACP